MTKKMPSIEGMESDEKLKHAALSLCSPNGLETEGKVCGEAQEGSTQGDPEVVGYFCRSWHQHIRPYTRRLSAVGGAVRAGADDLFIIGWYLLLISPEGSST